jgi:type IV secretory pathway ATPase VirB11/archaellum biosynthesis ATPase
MQIPIKREEPPVFLPSLLQAVYDLGMEEFEEAVKVKYYYLESAVGFDGRLRRFVVADIAPRFPPRLWPKLETIMPEVRDKAVMHGIRPYMQEYVDLMASYMAKALPKGERQHAPLYASMVHRLLYAYGALTPLISDEAYVKFGVTDVLIHITNLQAEQDVVEVESWRFKGRYPTNLAVTEEDRNHLRSSMSRRGITANKFTGWASQVDQRFRVRVTAAVPPISQPRTTMALRLVNRYPWAPPKYIALGSATPEQLGFLWHVWTEGFRGKPAFIVAIGQPGAGKTTLVDVVTATTPPDQPLAVVESVSEINAPQAKVRFAERFSLSTDIPEVRMAQLIKVALRMSVPYVTTNEVLGPEDAQAMFLAATIGTRVMTTIHAVSPEDLVARFKAMGVSDEAIAFVRDRMIVVLMDREPGRRFVKEIYVPEGGGWAPLSERPDLLNGEPLLKAKILHVAAKRPAYHDADEWLAFLKHYYEDPKAALSDLAAGE